MSTDRCTVLLIDLENFFIGRERKHLSQVGLKGKPYRGEPFADDLKRLLRYVGEMAGGRHLLVRRAYANFDGYQIVDRGASGKAREYYLRGVSETLMWGGIEPIQVFRYPGGSNKNAADMRLAMDATAIVTGDSRRQIDQFVLVTGDADFIPLALELKRHGMRVGVIGLVGSTKEVLGRYCDDFELFEELLAAETAVALATAAPPAPAASNAAPPPADPPAAIAPTAVLTLPDVKTALHNILGRLGPTKFAAVRPMLSKELGRLFDPSAFGFQNAGSFIERYKDEFGLITYPTPADKMVALAGAVAVERDYHSPKEYRELLRLDGMGDTLQTVHFHVVPWASFQAITDASFGLLYGDHGPVQVYWDQFQADLGDRLSGTVPAAHIPYVADVIQYRFGESAGEEAEGEGQGRLVRLADEVTAADDFRFWLLHTYLYLLRIRLEERNAAGPIKPEVFARMVNHPNPPPAELVEQVATLADDIYRPVEATAGT